MSDQNNLILFGQLLGEIKNHLTVTTKALDILNNQVDKHLNELYDKLNELSQQMQVMQERSNELDEILDGVKKAVGHYEEMRSMIKGLKSEIISDILTQTLLLKKHQQSNEEKQDRSSEEIPVETRVKRSIATALGTFMIKEWKFLTFILVLLIVLSSIYFNPEVWINIIASLIAPLLK
jgi:vacuolar-type H+-ATPase subunit I/STV1